MACKSKNVINLPVEDNVPHFRMIDVGRKRITRRRAIAAGVITLAAEAYERLKNRTLPKGDALALAEVSGITGAKKTPDILPMCHPLPLDQVTVHYVLDDASCRVTMYCQVAAHAKTGVEMEALAGVQAALLTIWDLTKGIDPALEISDLRLLVKEGGKSGLWTHPAGIPDWLEDQLAHEKTLARISAAIVVMSDRASIGEYEDRSGPVLQKMLEGAGAKVLDLAVIPDDLETITEHLLQLCECTAPDIVITSGGTGFGVRDVTPEALNKLCDRMIPGFGELLRADGAYFTDLSWLSRSCAGLKEDTLMIALPGSPKAVQQGAEILIPLLSHARSMILGKNHEEKEVKHV